MLNATALYSLPASPEVDSSVAHWMRLLLNAINVATGDLKTPLGTRVKGFCKVW